MDRIEFDGLYGEADTWLPEEDIDTAEKTVTESAQQTRPAADESIPDIDQYRH